MSQYQNIMAVVDPAMKRSTAFTRAVELAAKTGASLTLLLADYNPALYRARFLDPELQRNAIRGYLGARQRWLNTEVARLQESGIKAEGVAVWHKPPYEEVARQAKQRRPDLVIKDMEEVGRLARTVFTPNDWHLIRLCPSPLMLVNARSSSYPQRILAAVDPFDINEKPAELNDDILRAALSMAYQCDASVHVVHAYEYLPAAAPMGAETVFADAKLFEQVREDHRDQFIQFGRTHNIPDDRMHLIEGSPADVIADLARKINADLVVLGTVQRGGLKRILIGSTAEEILGSVDSDVLVLKPQDFVAALEAELQEVGEDRELPEPWQDFRRFSL